ncbi:MAG: cell division protein FtsA [Lactobacillus sp.]|nr:cell division protein FtsA [Lactobacillus sp.]
MENQNLLVGLDIGTSTIKAVVSDNGKVIGAAMSHNEGMSHGQIVDIDETAAAIKKAINELSEKAGSRINRVVTSIPVTMLQLETASGVLSVSDTGREVTNDDVKHVLNSAIKSAEHQGRSAISYLPSRFVIDGRTDVKDPRKMIAHSLAVTGILLTAPDSLLHNLNKAMEKAQVYNSFFVPAPLAVSSVALSEGERTFGSILLDLGGGTTSATVIHQGKIKYANVVLNGGIDVTKDISVVLATSQKEAESLKHDYGFADPELASSESKFVVPTVGASDQQTVDEKYLSEIINARIEQILTKIAKGLAKHDMLDLPGGIIITGGASAIQGIGELVSQGLGVKTRVYKPDQLGMRNSAYSVAYGIVNYVSKMTDIEFLATDVIYQTKLIQPEEDVQKPTIQEQSRPVGEKLSEEAYNKNSKLNILASKDKNKQDKKENKKNFKDFIKKFFD